MKNWINLVFMLFALSGFSQISINGIIVDGECVIGNDPPSGSIHVDVTGGIPPYSYLWSNGETTQNLLSLASGTYVVIVTDSSGETSSASFDLKGSTAIEVSAQENHLTCNAANGAADGSIDLEVTGGQKPYNFIWSSNNGSGLSTASEDQTGLGAGTYNLTISDANGCTLSQSFALTEPRIISVLASVTDPICQDSEGSIELTISGGTAPFVYLWTTADGSGLITTNKDQAGLSGGTYNLTVVDSNGCYEIASYTIDTTVPMMISGSVSDRTCHPDNGTANGAIDITVSGGLGTEESDYTYAWYSADGEGLKIGEADQSTLTAGTFWVVVTDSNGCTAKAAYTLDEPSPIEISYELIMPDCLSGSDTGAIDVTVVGGSGTYSYYWVGRKVQREAEDQNELQGGDYYVEVTDDFGCMVTAVIKLTDNNAPEVTLDLPTNLTCWDKEVTLSGGFPEGGYYSGTGVSGNSFSPSLAGTGIHGIAYTYINADGCMSRASDDIEVPKRLQVNAGEDKILSAEETVFATANVEGGYGSNAYSWSGPGDFASTGGSIMIETEGIYFLTITDSQGCTAADVMYVKKPDVLTAGLIEQPKMLCPSNDPQLIESIVSGLACNKLTNDEFNTTSDWFLHQQSGAIASLSLDANGELSGEHSAFIDILTNPNGDDSRVMLSQEIGVIYSDELYLFSFQAKATATKKITVELQESHAPYRTLGSKTFTIGTTATTYSWMDIAPQGHNNRVKVYFKLGADSADIWLDKASLQTTSCAEVAIDYVWEYRQKLATGFWTEWIEIFGSNAATYDPPVQQAHKEYRRLAFVQGSDEFVISNTIPVELCQTSMTQELSFEGKIYPNPANDILFIETENAISATLAEVTGKIVVKKNLSKGKNEFDISSYQAGAYYLQLTDGQSNWTEKIFIESK